MKCKYQSIILIVGVKLKLKDNVLSAIANVRLAVGGRTCHTHQALQVTANDPGLLLSNHLSLPLAIINYQCPKDKGNINVKTVTN